MLRNIAILFVREDSVYKLLPGCDCYDKTRDARTYPGGLPVIAHPPCRAWGRLRHMSKPEPGEKHLATWAVGRVRHNGGVLEHPSASSLWAHQKLPSPGDPPDSYGGYTIEVEQFWFGHRAEKATWLYIVGVPQKRLPFFLPQRGQPTHCITRSSRKDKPHVTHREREQTPPRFAEWLCDIARMTRRCN